MRDVRWADGTLHVRAYGAIAKAALVDAVRSLTADTRYDSVRFVVADFLDAELSEFSFLGVLEDVLVVLLGASRMNRRVRIAVVSRDPYIVELAHALVGFASDCLPSIDTFEDRRSVSAWIDRQPMRTFPSMRFRPR